MRKIDLLSYSDTVFDYCEECEGFFLDKGEIEQTNLELEEIVKDNLAEEFRGHIDGYLVRLDKISDVVVGGRFGFAIAQMADYLRISVYFRESLGLGLRVYSEKWTHKFIKAIGLFSKQDISIGNDRIDRTFIVQGSDTAGVIVKSGV